VVILKFLEGKQVFNVLDVPSQEVIHANDLITFFDEPIAEMRP
jgi:hypothetical protein